MLWSHIVSIALEGSSQAVGLIGKSLSDLLSLGSTIFELLDQLL